MQHLVPRAELWALVSTVAALRWTSALSSLMTLAIWSTPLSAGALGEVPLPGIRVIDVGQGLAVLVQGEAGDVVLIDSGPPGAAEAVLVALDRHGVDRVDLWIHTHYDTDHVGGFGRVVQGRDGRLGTADDIGWDVAWDRGLEQVPDHEAAAVYFALAADRRSQVEDGDEWSAAGLRVRAVLPSLSGPYLGENERGLAVCVELADTRLLVPGDLPAHAVTEAAARCGGTDLLVASHHGSQDGISAELVEVSDPDAVLVSAGRDNVHCHPAPELLALSANRTLWATGVAGRQRDGPCGELVDEWGDHHHLWGGDLWFPLGPSRSHGVVDPSLADESGRRVADAGLSTQNC